MEENFHVNILDKFQVSPLPDSITQSVSLPLTYFDIPWLSYAPNQTLFFYQKPPSETTTTAILAALLKQSLSHALHNFYPLAGTLTFPPPPAEPYMVYTKGDTISLTIAESSNNFNHLSGNHPRDITHLYSLLPKLPSPSMSARDTHVSLIDLPLLAIQITFFGELGFSIGVTSQHAAADERTLYEFMKCWASFCKSLLENESLFEFEFTFTPWFDRSVILDQNSLKTTLLKQWWNRINRLNSQKTSHEETKLTNHEIVQSTFVLSSSDINIIKHHIIEKCKMANDDPPVNLSLYETGVSYTWICLLKAQETTHDHAKDGNIYLGYNASGISRLKYEVPLSYFGCCIVFGRCGALESELLGEDGLVCATKSFDKEIERLVTDFLEGSERWICEWDELNTRIIGSPKVDFYGIDFGWGKAEKIEKLSSDIGHHGRVINVISLNGGRDLNGGLEIGVVLPRDKMSEFTCIFNSGLKEL